MKLKWERWLKIGLLCRHLNLNIWTNFPVIEVNVGNIIHVIVVNLQLPDSDSMAVEN